MTQTLKHARWDAQRRVSKLEVLPVRVGLLGWAVNMVLRRPGSFPTLEFARFRHQIQRQARRKPLTHADIAVVKLRAHLLSSAIDPRTSKQFDGKSVDDVMYDAFAAAERKHGVSLTSSEEMQVADAVWQQYADLFGFPLLGRTAQIDAADRYTPTGGRALARRLRELETEAVRATRELRRQV